MDFPDLLRLLDDRTAAFRAAVVAAPDLTVTVPTCPEWTLADLVRHIGEGRRRWAATVAAGPADGPAAVELPPPGADLIGWLDASTGALAAALREAGPDRECWTWWGPSQSPRDARAVARHQVQQLLVHAYDAQVTIGAPEPLPAEAALDGVDEFLTTCAATTIGWPHEPATVVYRTSEGRSWSVRLSAEGARVTDGEAPADVTVTGTPAELVLHFYGRIPVEAVTLTGDRGVLDRLIAWEPA